MHDWEHVWALVLAAGEGCRLAPFTTTQSGLTIPKQFCSLDRGPSLVQEALQRAAAVAGAERTCAIVALQHRQWWLEQLNGVPAKNIVVQPQNRGTANGVLLPLLMILERDPQARILIMPSDHYLRDEEPLVRALRYAAVPSERAGTEILLLGLEPEDPDSELGYIVPRRDVAQVHHAVARFVEKPDTPRAQVLLEEGALWNSFIIAADGPALLKLFERRCPEVVAAMCDALGSAEPAGADGALAALYETLANLDFSRSILQGQEEYLRVLPVPECGWSDLGTPQRVARALHALERRVAYSDAGKRMVLSLAAQHRRLRGGAKVGVPGAGIIRNRYPEPSG
ncbi:MAG TPA: sugar phosphate nucleotidyltransferase [Steroidobacteraceae bacterium]|nr:sugar phosphate nucleotidyltransferase [Steroidobacteraceae bacterium]